MTNHLPANKESLQEAYDLSSEILRNIELNELPLSNIALKGSRLARLLNEFDFQKIMECESGGYTSSPEGFDQEMWRLAGLAERRYQQKDKKTEEITDYSYGESIEEIEHTRESARASLEACSSEYVVERNRHLATIQRTSGRLSSRKTFIYRYVLRKHYELKFSGIVDDVFSRVRENVDANIGLLVPDAVKKFTAIYDNLSSSNSEDWSNAVHGCRRILQDLADSVFPHQKEDRIKHTDGKEKKIKLGADNYINRLMSFVDDNAESDKFSQVVGSHIKYIGNRLDSIFSAAQKGSHTTILEREEADRYVIYTYMIVGDILSLTKSLSKEKQTRKMNLDE